MSAVIDRPVLTTVQRSHRRSALFVRWLRKIHLYVGLWGAALGLVFGATGLLMNHRALLKIPVEKMITHRFSIGEAEEAFRMFDERKTEKAVFVWD